MGVISCASLIQGNKKQLEIEIIFGKQKDKYGKSEKSKGELFYLSVKGTQQLQKIIIAKVHR